MSKDNNQMTKILIVDDVQLNLDMMKEILSEKEYMIATAINGKSAIAKAKAHKFDLILLDVVLPDIDGFDVYSHLKSNQQTHDIPIIFLIEKKDTDSINKGFQLGVIDYIPKPFSKEELLHKVNFHLMHRKTQDELIRLKEMFDVAVNAKNNFLANISHEIRTPMNGIIGMVDVLKLSQLTEEQHEYLEIIGMSGDNLLIIINDLLDLSRMEAGQVIINKIKFNLLDLVNEVITLISHKAVEKKLDLSFLIDPEVPQFLIGDPSRLKQVFINLCNNAIKFTNEGSVHIHAGIVDTNESTVRLYFEIQDTGIGISPENQSKLFKSFTQVDASLTRKFGGTGMGLVISKNLIELMSGKIRIISEEGKGAIFHFDCEFGLPTPIISADKNQKLDGSSIPQDIKLKVLLAEDNLINQKIAILNLEKLGHSVIVVSNGIQAVERFISESPDVILMDIQMPEMDGIEATTKIREWEQQNKDAKRVPIVALTANTMKSAKEIFFATGMDDYLSKPFNVSELTQVLSRICPQL